MSRHAAVALLISWSVGQSAGFSGRNARDRTLWPAHRYTMPASAAAATRMEFVRTGSSGPGVEQPNGGDRQRGGHTRRCKDQVVLQAVPRAPSYCVDGQPQ